MSIARTLRFLPFVLLPLAGCQDALDTVVVTDKVEHPLPSKLVEKMRANDMATRSPIMMRIFKEESVLEVWKQKGNGRFDKIAEYEICKWSGKLGPKIKEGDRQAPEGYYRIYPAQMNPRSSYYLSFNMGFPNSFDRAHGRTGTNLMVHGACSSAGCYSMTDEQVLEIYGFAREAFRGGQEYFTVAAYPFRMTPENMARHHKDPNFEFWKMLKVGYDHFELTKRPPKVDVCEKRYVFNQQTADPNAKFNPSGACPAMETPAQLAFAYANYEKSWNQAFEVALAKEQKAEEKRLAAAAAKAEAEARKAEAAQRKAEAEAARLARIQAGEEEPSPIRSIFSKPVSLFGKTPEALAPQERPAAEAATPVAEARSTPSVTAPTTAAEAPKTVPVPTPNPAQAADVAEPAPVTADAGKKPFWKIWSTN
jgi:Uncharacterized protein conserved in bacteria